MSNLKEKAFPMERLFLFEALCSLLIAPCFLFRSSSRIQQIIELIQFRHDDDTGAAIRRAAISSTIRSQGVVLSAACSDQLIRIDLVFILHDAYNSSSPVNAQIPIVL